MPPTTPRFAQELRLDLPGQPARARRPERLRLPGPAARADVQRPRPVPLAVRQRHRDMRVPLQGRHGEFDLRQPDNLRWKPFHVDRGVEGKSECVFTYDDRQFDFRNLAKPDRWSS